ncbi:hypothetical protein E2C01_003276 [Portunus trituberculatus]|uniref:Uncharacterized protein n=1 Tax=Portunus trituberculatus TaxID=210409 RepID=A0A5B7CNG9_PORTR|nr:hypothetical protein [Portunus trituberculatus]
MEPASLTGVGCWDQRSPRLGPWKPSGYQGGNISNDFSLYCLKRKELLDVLDDGGPLQCLYQTPQEH